MSEIDSFLFSTSTVPDHAERTVVRIEHVPEQPVMVYTGQEAAWRLRRKVYATAAGISGTSEARFIADSKIREEPACIVPDWFEVSEGVVSPGVGFVQCVVENLPKRLCGRSRGKDAGKAMLRFLEWWIQQFELMRIREGVSE